MNLSILAGRFFLWTDAVPAGSLAPGGVASEWNSREHGFESYRSFFSWLYFGWRVAFQITGVA